MSEPLVTSRHLLDALLELQRMGSKRTLSQLEHAEPDLAAYAMETLSFIYGNLIKLGGRAKPTAQVYHDFQSLLLVCIGALRQTASEDRQETAESTSAASSAPLDEPVVDPPRRNAADPADQGDQ